MDLGTFINEMALLLNDVNSDYVVIYKKFFSQKMFAQFPFQVEIEKLLVLKEFLNDYNTQISENMEYIESTGKYLDLLCVMNEYYKNKLDSIELFIKIMTELEAKSNGDLRRYSYRDYTADIDLLSKLDHESGYDIGPRLQLLFNQYFVPEQAQQPQQPQQNNAKKKGCYIATKVYGSYDCSQVWVLRRYRDNVLANHVLGRIFIKIYYEISPYMVSWFGNTKWFNTLFRKVLDSRIQKLIHDGIQDTPYTD